MGKEKEKTKKIPISAGKLFGLAKDPVIKANFPCFFILTATVDKNGEIIEYTKTDQSWMMFEALHKLERMTEQNIIELMKGSGS